MSEELEDDIRHIWRLRRGSDSTKGPRFTLEAEVHGLFVEPTRDEVRTALTQILDEALGPDPQEIAGWGEAGALDLERSELPDDPERAELNAWAATARELDEEVERLHAWKLEATPLLETLDRCHDLLPPGDQAPLGHSKAEAVHSYLTRLHDRD